MYLTTGQWYMVVSIAIGAVSFVWALWMRMRWGAFLFLVSLVLKCVGLYMAVVLHR